MSTLSLDNIFVKSCRWILSVPSGAPVERRVWDLSWLSWKEAWIGPVLCYSSTQSLVPYLVPILDSGAHIIRRVILSLWTKIGWRHLQRLASYTFHMCIALNLGTVLERFHPPKRLLKTTPTTPIHFYLILINNSYPVINMIFCIFVFVSCESPTYTAQAKRVNDKRHKQNTNYKNQVESWKSQPPWLKLLEGSAVLLTAYL